MAALHSLYHLRDQASEGMTETDWRKDLRTKFKSRVPFEFGFCSYISVRFLKYCCCCFAKRWDKDSNSWYHQRRIQSEKFKIAREKLNSEVDLHSMIKLQRITRFLLTQTTNRRQRNSVGFFRKYTIENYHLDQKNRRQRQAKLTPLE